MSTFFIVEADNNYKKHHRELSEALADFLRLYLENKTEDIALRYSA